MSKNKQLIIMAFVLGFISLYIGIPSVSAATFTVNSTGDQSDTSAGDGVCVTSVATCTLRAAIQEANALSGADTIAFNIPVTDAGFRDYNAPAISNSGNTLPGLYTSDAGDDYWTIQPATALPTIIEQLTIDGNTQTTSNGNTNTSGPEIEIEGSVAGGIGLTFNATATGSTLNAVIVNRFPTYQIIEYSDNFVLTNSILGLDAKGISNFPNQTVGLRVDGANNVVIGHNTSDGNVIAGMKSAGNAVALGVYCYTPVTARQITISGNIIGGINKYGNTLADVPDAGIYLEGECDAVVGGNTSAEKNVVSRTIFGISSYTLNPAFTSNQHIQIYNNFVGTDLTGTQNRGNTGNGIHIVNDLKSGSPAAFNQNIMIGDAGKGNLIRFNISGGIRIRGNRPLIAGYNTISDNGLGFWIGNQGLNDNKYKEVYVVNNYVGASASDPYFSVSTGGNSTGIGIQSSSPNVFGNKVVQNVNGIEAFPFVTGGVLLTSTPTIGGTGAYTGSLCAGTKANCVQSNSFAGIFSEESVPTNEATLYTDNVFVSPNGTDFDKSIVQAWFADFEIFTNTTRRTDLANGTVNFLLPSNLLLWTGGNIPSGSLITSQTNKLVTCNGGATYCPASGATSGTSGSEEALLNSTNTMGAVQYSLYSTAEYVYDYLGNKVTHGTQKFDVPHLVSKQFSFDGDCTTDPVSPDRAEPWSINLSGNRNIATQNFCFLQKMDLDLVDANPIWNGSEWVITVDSTTDEDNVSLTGFNDGAGVYSGGGVNGVNGISNGKTSLREAIIVSNKFGQPVKIAFNIPTSDPGWNTVSAPNAFRILLTANLPSVSKTVTIDGNTQTSFTGDTNLAVVEPEAMPVVGNATTGPEVIVDGNNLFTGPTITGAGTSITVDRLGFKNTDGNRTFSVSAGIGTITLKNSTFTNFRRGVLNCNDSVTLDVENNVFYQDTTVGVFGADMIECGSAIPNATINNNQFINSRFAALGFLSLTSTHTVTITNNLFKSSGTAGLESQSAIYIQNALSTFTITNNVFTGLPKDGIDIWNGGRAKIQNNKFYNIAGEPIDLSAGTILFTQPQVWGDGVTPNDSGDSDTGPNDLMNYPDITQVTFWGGGQYTVAGDMDNAVSGESPKVIEICESDNNLSGHGGCLRTLGFALASSPWQVTFTIPGDTGTEGRIFSALATNNLNATSEFSLNFVTTANPNYFIITPTPTPSATVAPTSLPTGTPTPTVTEEPTLEATPVASPTIISSRPASSVTPTATKQTSGELENGGISPLLYVCLIVIILLLLIFAFLLLQKRNAKE